MDICNICISCWSIPRYGSIICDTINFAIKFKNQGWKEVSRSYHDIFQNSSSSENIEITKGLLFTNNSATDAFQEFRDIVTCQKRWHVVDNRDDFLLEAAVVHSKDIHISENLLMRLQFEIDCKSPQSVLKRFLVPEGLAVVYSVSKSKRIYYVSEYKWSCVHTDIIRIFMAKLAPSTFY